MYKMISVKQETKDDLKEIKENIGNPGWDNIVSDYIDILNEGNVEERGDLIQLKQDIIRWLNEQEE